MELDGNLEHLCMSCLVNFLPRKLTINIVRRPYLRRIFQFTQNQSIKYSLENTNIIEIFTGVQHIRNTYNIKGSGPRLQHWGTPEFWIKIATYHLNIIIVVAAVYDWFQMQIVYIKVLSNTIESVTKISIDNI